MCKRESSAKFEEKSPTLPYSADSNGQLAPFLTVDCRGLEFIGFDPRVSPIEDESASAHKGSGDMEVCRG